MAIKIVISDTVGLKVQGSINDAAGVPKPFDFRLTCRRLDADQIQSKLKSDSEASLTDFMIDITEGWSGVLDGEGDDMRPVPYSDENMRQLCKIPGVAAVAFKTYLSDVGAKEKN